MIKEIERLNREIDRIMTEKTKADAQKEVWESRLIDSIQSYSKEYGVDLSGNDLSEIKQKLINETNIVETKTKEEFDKSVKIVNLINSGDIKGAWKVLGVDIDNTENLEVAENSSNSDGVKANNQEIQGAIEAVEEMDDNDFYGEGFDDEDEYIESNQPVNLTPVKPKVVNNQNTLNEQQKPKQSIPFIMEEDDDEDEFVIPTTRNSNSINNTPKSNTSNSTLVVDDDDDGDDFGGFGNILAGSKFKV